LTVPRVARLDVTWAALMQNLGSHRVAIIGLGGRYEHWTVAYAASSRCLYLADSAELKLLLRSRCTTSRKQGLHKLSPNEIVLMSRVEMRWQDA